jgi:hypothetical protein
MGFGLAFCKRMLEAHKELNLDKKRSWRMHHSHIVLKTKGKIDERKHKLAS